MGDLVGSAFLILILGGILWVGAKALGFSIGGRRDPLDDPRVEWRVWEATGLGGSTVWNWRVTVGTEANGNYDFAKFEALTHARAAARRLLGQGDSIGKTRPCPLCGKPSQVGKETDTDECARLLQSARAELPNSVL